MKILTSLYQRFDNYLFFRGREMCDHASLFEGRAFLTKHHHLNPFTSIVIVVYLYDDDS
jgi:hypothetical protein